MRISEMTGTIQVESIELPITAQLWLQPSEELRNLNEQLRESLSFKMAASGMVYVNDAYSSRVYREFEQEHRHQKQVRKLAKRLARKPRKYRVAAHAGTVKRRGGKGTKLAGLIKAQPKEEK